MGFYGEIYFHYDYSHVLVVIPKKQIRALDFVQTIANDHGPNIHLDYLNYTKIWAEWIMCIICWGKCWLIFTNTDWFNNNNEIEQSNMYKFCALQSFSLGSQSSCFLSNSALIWRQSHQGTSPWEYPAWPALTVSGLTPSKRQPVWRV